jgi:outer membrane protein OmpA-like peptidoglycan-associated protein
VRDLFVRGGVSMGVIRTVGAGERYPVVHCEGTRTTPALVECLQPNRRVEIEVVGVTQ